MPLWTMPASVSALLRPLAACLDRRTRPRFWSVFFGLLLCRERRRTASVWFRAAGIGHDFRRAYDVLGSVGRQRQRHPGRLTTGPTPSAAPPVRRPSRQNMGPSPERRGPSPVGSRAHGQGRATERRRRAAGAPVPPLRSGRRAVQVGPPAVHPRQLAEVLRRRHGRAPVRVRMPKAEPRDHLASIARNCRVQTHPLPSPSLPRGVFDDNCGVLYEP